MAFSGNIPKIKNPVRIYLQDFSMFIGGERGIRTPGTSRYGSFQDYCNRPLYHLSLIRGITLSRYLKSECKGIVFFRYMQIFESFFAINKAK